MIIENDEGRIICNRPPSFAYLVMTETIHLYTNKPGVTITIWPIQNDQHEGIYTSPGQPAARMRQPHPCGTPGSTANAKKCAFSIRFHI